MSTTVDWTQINWESLCVRTCACRWQREREKENTSRQSRKKPEDTNKNISDIWNKQIDKLLHYRKKKSENTPIMPEMRHTTDAKEIKRIIKD